MVGRSNLILDPTLALIRAQLGFRIQDGAECGNININISVRNGTLSSKLGDQRLLKALDIIPDLNMDFSALVEAHMSDTRIYSYVYRYFNF